MLLRLFLPVTESEGAEQDFLELLAETEVDEEVGGGVGDESQLVQAGQAQEPQGRTELVTASADL